MSIHTIYSAGDDCEARHFQATQELFEVAHPNRYVTDLAMLGTLKRFDDDSEAIISA